MENRLEEPTILESNYFYFFIAIVLVTLGALAQSWDFNKGILITEFGIILLPTVIFTKLRGYSLKHVLRLNKLSLKQFFLVPLITMLAYPIGVFINYIMIIVLSLLGKVRPNPIPIPETGGEYLLGLFVIAISAGICEEVMFRGLMLKTYERLGKKKAIFISAILFGAFHFNLQNLFGPIFLGVLFGYILLKTNSIFATMLAHATNNAFALTLGVLLNKLLQNLNESTGLNQSISEQSMDQLNSLPKGVQLLSYSFWLIPIAALAIICSIIIYKLLKILPDKDKQNDDIFMIREKEVKIRNYFGQLSTSKKVFTVLPIILAGVLFVYQGYLFITL
ncbi:type II CAAX endopeptidase family protein [Sporosalibacterium faouarense]|uniref:type II CAAX endopeptidase family protein n=1 Tax=Sporosalibacterium faouarense TaxID=516123 RepID=UPI00141D4954|nr:type II CAAX endopeptidase family protein [Sporosalibacterium faouarense]MTI49536.1 CPBP family intramembrane metalloprotease [Bacillota bacterium]